MPLVIPTLPKIDDLREIIGKLYFDESIPVDATKDFSSFLDNDKVDLSKVVFKSQLPNNTIIIKQDVDSVAIVRAMKSGLTPIITDYNDIIIHIY